MLRYRTETFSKLAKLRTQLKTAQRRFSTPLLIINGACIKNISSLEESRPFGLTKPQIQVEESAAQTLNLVSWYLKACSIGSSAPSAVKLFSATPGLGTTLKSSKF